MNKINFKVWDHVSGMTTYIPHDVYKMTVNFPGTNRVLEFVGMDRGSCIMQAEVAREEGDTVLLVDSEESVTLYKKEKHNVE